MYLREIAQFETKWLYFVTLRLIHSEGSSARALKLDGLPIVDAHISMSIFI